MERIVLTLALVLASAGAFAQQNVEPSPGTLPGETEQSAAAPEEQSGPLPGEFAGTVTIASDYLFRGISQTDEAPAIQGSLDWKHPLGPFVGVWGSNVDFDDGDQAGVELDWYAGYAASVRQADVDLRVIYYSYPGANTPRDYDYWEVGGTVSVKPLARMTLSAGYNYSPDFFNESGDGHYLHGEVRYEIPGMALPLALTGGVGRQWIKDNVVFGTPDYWHWNAGLELTVNGIKAALTYADTDIEQRRCGAALGVCGQRVMASLSHSF